VIEDYEGLAARVRDIPGVVRVAPLVKAQVMANLRDRTVGVQVFGITPENLMTIPRVAGAEVQQGDIARFSEGIAIGSGIARELGVRIGDRMKLISPNGARTAFGTKPRQGVYEVVYIFTAGRYDIDRTRVYMPFDAAQKFFNRDGVADELEVMVADPDAVETYASALYQAGGPRALLWTWKDASGSFLSALDVEDNVMFIIMSILVLIAAMNIVSGLIMLVKNKGRDIGVLRTIGLTEGAVLRVFFICGALTGVLGTLFGVVLGCLFAIYFEPIFVAFNAAMGGDAWDPAVRGISQLPTKLEFGDVLTAVALSLGLSFTVTYFPARRAARMNPVDALRYE